MSFGVTLVIKNLLHYRLYMRHTHLVVMVYI